MPIFTPIFALVHAALSFAWALSLLIKYNLFKQIRAQIHSRLGGDKDYKHPKVQGYWVGVVGVLLLSFGVSDLMVSGVASIAEAEVWYYQVFTNTIGLAVLFMGEYIKDKKNKFALGQGLINIALYVLFSLSHLLDGGALFINLINVALLGGFGYLVFLQSGGDVKKIKDFSALDKTLQLIESKINDARGSAGDRAALGDEDEPSVSGNESKTE